MQASRKKTKKIVVRFMGKVAVSDNVINPNPIHPLSLSLIDTGTISLNLMDIVTIALNIMDTRTIPEIKMNLT